MPDERTDGLTHEELVKLISAQDFLLDRSRELLEAVITEWHEIPADERLARVRRAYAPHIIDPWPARPEVVAALRLLCGLAPPEAKTTT